MERIQNLIRKTYRNIAPIISDIHSCYPRATQTTHNPILQQ